MAPAGYVWTPVSCSHDFIADSARIGSDRAPRLEEADASSCEKKARSVEPLVTASDAVTEKLEVEPAMVVQRSGLGCGVAYQRDELLLVRQFVTSSSECGSLGFSCRSVRSVEKPKSEQSSCGTAEGGDENPDEFEQDLHPAAPEFAPRCTTRSGQAVFNTIAAKTLHPRRPVRRGSRKHAGEFVHRGFQGRAPQVLTANAKEFVPQQGCLMVAPGLTASDIEFILNPLQPRAKRSVQVPGFSANAPEFVPRSARSDGARATQESALNAYASEFCPESMLTKDLHSKPDSALSSRLGVCAASAWQTTHTQLEHDVAVEFVPHSLAACDEPVSVHDLAGRLPSPVLRC